VAVQVIHPINLEIAAEGTYGECERCPRAFSSVGNSLLTFTQTLLAGDDWGKTAVPIIERAPLTYFFFMLVLTTTCIAVLNLMLAAIVEAAQQARALGDREIARMKEKARAQAADKFRHLCGALDTNQNGTISFDELQQGYGENEDFANIMKTMDVTYEDMRVVFNILDKDKSGDIDYDEFVSQLHKMKSNDSHMMLTFIKHYTKRMHDDMLHNVTLVTHETHGHLKEALNKLDVLLTELNVDSVGRSAHAPSGNGAPLPPWDVHSAAKTGSCNEVIAGKSLAAMPGNLPLFPPEIKLPQSQARPDDLRQLGQVPPWQSNGLVLAEANIMHAQLRQLDATFQLAHNGTRHLTDTRPAWYHARIQL